MIIPPETTRMLAQTVQEMSDRVCKDLHDFAEYLRKERLKNETADNGRKDNEMKHEMTAREFLKAKDRMCNYVRGACGLCPFYSECGSDLSEYGIAIVEKWAAKHPEPKPTMFVPDEITRVTTIEMTQIVPDHFLDAIGHRELTEDEIEKLEDGIRELFKLNYSPDDLHIKVQQFVTKCHEEEI